MAPDDVVLGIDFGGTKVALALAGVDGRPVSSERIDTHAERGAEQAVERALERARQLAAAAGGRCVAAGAVSPGVVHDDRVELAPNVPGLEQLALAQRLREGLGVPTAVANDVKAAALAESRWGSLEGADPALLVNLGTGVAAGIVIGGTVLEGAHGAAGEIGYSLPGPLERIVGGGALGERGSRLLERTVSAAELFAHDDPRVQALLDDALDRLATQVANVAILVDPQRIAVGGGLMRSSDRILPALRRRLDDAAPFPPELVAARFADDGALRGALALALETARGEAPIAS